jgi:anti-sigma regulatory factor (Ser/Thr protein kinase)
VSLETQHAAVAHDGHVVHFETQHAAIPHDGHIVHIYEHDGELVQAVCPYLTEAFGAGEAAIVIATAAHRRAFEAELGTDHADALERVCSEHSAVLASASFPATSASPAHARRMATATLRRWGYDGQLVDDASLIVSELASNAVRHARSAFSLTLRMQGQLLRVTVEDQLPLPHATPDPGLVPRPPHGLCVVDSLATGWGVESTREGKLVWAQLACAGYSCASAG